MSGPLLPECELLDNQFVKKQLGDCKSLNNTFKKKISHISIQFPI